MVDTTLVKETTCKNFILQKIIANTEQCSEHIEIKIFSPKPFHNI